MLKLALTELPYKDNITVLGLALSYSGKESAHRIYRNPLTLIKVNLTYTKTPSIFRPPYFYWNLLISISGFEELLLTFLYLRSKLQSRKTISCSLRWKSNVSHHRIFMGVFALNIAIFRKVRLCEKSWHSKSKRRKSMHKSSILQRIVIFNTKEHIHAFLCHHASISSCHVIMHDPSTFTMVEATNQLKIGVG